MAEFAIILPFLLLLVAAIVDFGFYLYDFVSTHTAVRAGAQAAIQATVSGVPKYSDSEVKQIIRTAHGPVNPITDSEIAIWTKPSDPAFGSSHTSVTIAVNHRHAFIFPAFILRGSPDILISSRLKTIRVNGLAP